MENLSSKLVDISNTEKACREIVRFLLKLLQKVDF